MKILNASEARANLFSLVEQVIEGDRLCGESTDDLGDRLILILIRD